MLLARPAARITRAEVVNALDDLAKTGRAAMAGMRLAYGRACYQWAEKRGKVPSTPFQGLPISAGATEGDRVLSDADLAAVWQGAGEMPCPFGPFTRMAILTLQRREEVAGMRWSEINHDLSVWMIPGTRMKNGKAHDVHLAGAAREVLRSVTRLDDTDYVFTTTPSGVEGDANPPDAGGPTLHVRPVPLESDQSRDDELALRRSASIFRTYQARRSFFIAISDLIAAVVVDRSGGIGQPR